MAQKRKSSADGAFNADELLAFLRQDELDYPAGALKFGEAALPFLKELVASSDENLAMKSAYLVGYIEGDEADKILEEAANTGSVPIRVAAAFGAKNRSSSIAESILKRSLEDSSPSVVKFALLSAKASKLEGNLKGRINQISEKFADDTIKMAASEMLKKLKK